ncbi:MAG TPA: hypothetical protein VK145_00015 [Candidatus Nanoarchaeia archaeon]|nr:hypothetical protein [Candidatus Nanoarchaeia archaeon]
MDTNLVEKLKGQLSILPENLQNFVMKTPWMDDVESIAHKYNLDEEQTEGLRQEIMFVLFGIEKLSSLRANLVEELDITYDQALKIAFDANAQIFNPVMEDIRITQGIIERGDEPEQTPTSKPEPANPLIPNPSKSGIAKIGPETDPVHILMDHKEMERVDGPHLHSQNVMPHSAETSRGKPFSQSPAGSEGRSGGSIVDQKLSRIFKSSSTPSAPATPKPITKGYVSDPYREPLE